MIKVILGVIFYDVVLKPFFKAFIIVFLRHSKKANDLAIIFLKWAKKKGLYDE